MTRSTALCIAVASLCACAPSLAGKPGAPWAGDCTLKLTNDTTLAQRQSQVHGPGAQR